VFGSSTPPRGIVSCFSHSTLRSMAFASRCKANRARRGADKRVASRRDRLPRCRGRAAQGLPVARHRAENAPRERVGRDGVRRASRRASPARRLRRAFDSRRSSPLSRPAASRGSLSRPPPRRPASSSNERRRIARLGQAGRRDVRARRPPRSRPGTALQQAVEPRRRRGRRSRRRGSSALPGGSWRRRPPVVSPGRARDGPAGGARLVAPARRTPRSPAATEALLGCSYIGSRSGSTRVMITVIYPR